MGCFSFKCKECKQGINSSSHDGEMVKLFLLKDGKVLQTMEGEYDSYGRVFVDKTKVKGFPHLRKSQHWKDPTPEIPLEPYWAKDVMDPECHGYWLRVCDLMCDSYDRDNSPNGIAAIHSKCFKKVPTTASSSDPDQGWNKIKKRHINPATQKKTKK